ncbi:MAG: hypothetical protein AVDCRST_MAG59-3378, partial [uncultured Thermomicrobiales bacterium]
RDPRAGRLGRRLDAARRQRLRQGRQHRRRGERWGDPRADVRRRPVRARPVGLLRPPEQLDRRRRRADLGGDGAVHRRGQDDLHLSAGPARRV